MARSHWVSRGQEGTEGHTAVLRSLASAERTALGIGEDSSDRGRGSRKSSEGGLDSGVSRGLTPPIHPTVGKTKNR